MLGLEVVIRISAFICLGPPKLLAWAFAKAFIRHPQKLKRDSSGQRGTLLRKILDSGSQIGKLAYVCWEM